MATQMRVGNIIQNEKASWINMHKYIIFFFTVQFFLGVLLPLVLLGQAAVAVAAN